MHEKGFKKITWEVTIMLTWKFNCNHSMKGSYQEHCKKHNCKKCIRESSMNLLALLCILYCTLVKPYLTCCCEFSGNNYKTSIQPLFILQKRAIRICLNNNYKCHKNHCFSLGFMYKAFHN